MMLNYEHKNIWVNGRLVSITDVLAGIAAPHSIFEQHFFSFLKSYLEDQQQFTIHTSGSTGTPKDILITKAQMDSSALQTIEALRLTKNSNALLCMDPRYIGGRMMVVRALLHSMKIYAVEPSANPLAHIPVDVAIHFAAFVPYQVQSMLESKHPHLLNDIEIIIIGGGALREETLKVLQAYQCKIYATYGMTETISHIALQRINTVNKETHFTVLPGIKISADARSCLLIDAPYLSSQVVTNDLVEIVQPNQFKWLGRYDNVINSGGIKIIPEVVEAALSPLFQSKNINNRFFIYSVPDLKLGNKVVLVIEGGLSSPEILIETLKAFNTVPSQKFQTPKQVYQVNQFTNTDTGKINRYRSFQDAVSLLSL